MKINEWDIKNANAQQWKITFSPSTFENNSVWDAGSLTPAFLPSDIGKKTIKIVMMVRGSSRETILNNISAILSHLLEPAELYLDNYSGGTYNHTFYGVMTKSTTSEFVQDRVHKLTIEFMAIERGRLMIGSVERPQELVVNNPGNIPTPFILNIIPTVGMASITVIGCFKEALRNVDRGCKINNLLTNQQVSLNGETGLILNGASIADAEFYQFPLLQPGANTIKFSSDFINVSYSFYPRYF